MHKKKILVLLGHPNWDTMCGYLATRYEEGAREAGHEVKRVNLGELQFDPILHKGYKEIQALEPDLLQLQNDFRWADHITVVYPNWWSTMPALLKGLLDRMFLPGFAFRMRKGSLLGLWDKLLKGRTGRLIVTMDNPPLLDRLFMGDYTHDIRKGVFWFSGIWPTRVTAVGKIKNMSPEDRTAAGDKVYKLGTKAL
jgi:putative NADPH-quinone reductase